MKIGWSDFAIKQNKKQRHSYFKGSHKKLIELVEKNWRKRKPGMGRKDLKKVVVVPITGKEAQKLFVCPYGMIESATHLRAKVTRRQPNEDPYIEVHGRGKPLLVNYAKVVLYSADTLLENDGERSGDYDWEIVAIIAGPYENEPMSPLTMARNFLQKPGGTFAPYTAAQFADSIYYWSQLTKVSK